MISGFIIILVVALLIVWGVRRGIAATLMNLLALAAAGITANLLSSALAHGIYNAFFKASVTQSIRDMITQGGEEYASQNSLDSLPGAIRGILGFFLSVFGLDNNHLQSRIATSTIETDQVVNSIEKPIGELAVFVISLILLIVLFIVLLIVFKLLARPAMRAFNLPVVRQVNMIFGGLIGAVEGIVLACFLVNVAYLYVNNTNPDFLNNSSVFGGLFNALVIFR